MNAIEKREQGNAPLVRYLIALSGHARVGATEKGGRWLAGPLPAA